MVRKSRMAGKNSYGYPVHNKLSALICFNESCIRRQESINFRKKYRFKGFENNKPPERKTTPENQEPEKVIASNTSKPVANPEPDLNHTQILQHVYFETGKANLKPESSTELDELLDKLQKHPAWHITVSGHTDNIGDENINLDLSRRRAEAVIEYLAAKGISRNRLAAKGYGSSTPVASNDTKEGRNRNRRVEFTISSHGK